MRCGPSGSWTRRERNSAIKIADAEARPARYDSVSDDNRSNRRKGFAMTPLESTATAIPPLEPGDRLSRAEFERRYNAMPGLKKAELIEGIVYLPSPVRFHRHGQPHFDLIGWLAYYKFQTPGVLGADNATARLDLDNEPQPDVLLMIDPARGGQAKISNDDYVEEAPELVAEVAASSVSFDLHTKLAVYRRNGVREYLVWRVMERQIDWFVARDGTFVPLEADAEGILRSEVFPGLWLDAAALIRGDLRRVLTVLQQGLASAEHTAFLQG
jgi:Uma2 family endonuclease